MTRLIIKPEKTIRQKVHEYLREEILRGGFEPLERLIEANIAKEIGTSRTPVREALHSLEREGLIESKPRVGYVVKEISPSEIDEIYRIRGALEALALTWALTKNREPLIKDLKENLAQTREMMGRSQTQRFEELDAAFHEAITGHSGSPRLMEMTSTLRRHMLRLRLMSMFTADRVQKAYDGHLSIVKAIERGDGAAAAQAIEVHMRQTRDIILKTFTPDK